MMDFSPLHGLSYCVVGDPVDHSRSPAMQNAAFERCGMGRCYGRLRVTRDDFDEFLAYARKHLAGVNVTVPLKEEAARKADVLAPSAQDAHSVNTLVIRDGIVTGESTDGYGLRRALASSLGFSATRKTLLFLGAGGAARAAGFTLAAEGAARIFLLNRTVERADALARELREKFPALETDAAAFGDREKCTAFFGAADLVLQCTPLGWRDDDPPVVGIPDTHAAFFDFVYRETPFLREAKRRGLPYADGLEMLLYQGVASFRAWMKKEPPIRAMRRALKG